MKVQSLVLPHWSNASVQFCAAIRATPALVKFVTKVKDDSNFLRKWIAHHAAIAGMENLIVFDNMSTSPEMIQLYEEFGGQLKAIQFSGFHNHLHRPEHFPEMYASLQASCKYYQVSDVDEFLTFIDDSLRHDVGLVRSKLEQWDFPVIPTVWLENQTGKENAFRFGRSRDQLPVNIGGGKPILAATTPVEGIIGHNFQVKQSSYGSLRLNFFLMHMKWLLPEQRIAANMAKLRAYKQLSADATIDDVLAIDVSTMEKGNPRMWVTEIHRLHATEALKPSPVGEIVLEEDGSITFQTASQAEWMHRLLTSPDQFGEAIFKRSARK
jgi:hypothetical protein